MSWNEAIQNRIKITTGDGEIYTPLSQVTSNRGSFDFNISEFEFPEVAGTKVDRRLHKGTRYPLEFYFQGADNIDQMKGFIVSSRDTRPWEIIHPIYGQFTAHPLSIEFDNSGIHITKINCTVVETILEGGPKITSDLQGTALASVEDSKNSILNFGSIVQPNISDITLMQTNARNLYEQAFSLIKDQTISNEYFNAFTVAENKINVALNSYNTGITAIQDFINYPANFIQSVKSKIAIIKAQSEKLTDQLRFLTQKSSKQIYESQKGALVLSAIESSLKPIEDDYINSVDVLFIIDEILQIYNGFIYELQSIQSIQNDLEESYSPDAEFMFNLNFSINYAVSNLFSIALSAQQERIIYLEHDSNVIIEAHRFYGLLEDDSTIQRFINTNEIQMNELIQLKKGRKIKYYI